MCWLACKSVGIQRHSGENPVRNALPNAISYAFEESSCLGMQLKLGGKFHLKLNIGERPIANKYREGKMKSTLERELTVREIVERETLEVRLACRETGWQASISFRGQKRVRGTWQLRLCYSLLLDLPLGIEERSTLFARSPDLSCLGCWLNGFKRPVLKHGPRSLTCLRVFGCQTRTRNESEWRSEPQGARSTGLDFL